MRVALYARFSSDLQRPTSIADQLRAARARAAAEAWPVVAEHADEAISGATPLALRRGGKALLADALAGRFDILIVEGLDRIAREIGEQEQVVKRLEHRGIRIIGTADGYDSAARGRKVMRVARGLVNELYLDDLREKTHRGLAGQFDRGLSAGGRSYGYRTVEAPGGGRRIVVDPTEAAVVLRIFREYADGSSVRAIVHRLNAEGIPSARGGTWAVSALHGSSEKGLGLLRNELYVGRVLWNRRQWIKDPDSGRRRYVERPRAEWQAREAPDLRIVPADLWERARQRERTGPARGTRTGRGAIPRTLFGGMLRCPECGGPMIAIDGRRYGCNVHKDRGGAQCGNAATFRRDDVDRGLVAAVRDELLSPAALQDVREVAREVLAARARGGDDAAAARKRLQAVKGEIERIVDAIAAVGVSAALRARLAAAEAERDQLERQVGAATAGGDGWTAERLVAEYRRTMLVLGAALESGERDQTRALLSDLLGPVTLVREGDAVFAEFDEPMQRAAIVLRVASGSGCEGAQFLRKRRRLA